MAYSPARVFAALVPATREVCGEERSPGSVKAPCCRCRGSGRVVEVTGSAELSAVPDRATVSVAVSHSKESVSDCSTSVTRRLDYILQTLRQNGIKEEDFSVMKHIQREQDLYRVQAEVIVVFSDFEKMQRVRSVLIEKLDKTVHVGDPSFSHSPECLSLLRRRVCAAAVETARLKALEVCNMLGQALGRPLLVREDESREWRTGQHESIASHPIHEHNVGQTISASSQVFVTFELRPKDGTRKR